MRYDSFHLQLRVKKELSFKELKGLLVEDFPIFFIENTYGISESQAPYLRPRIDPNKIVHKEGNLYELDLEVARSYPHTDPEQTIASIESTFNKLFNGGSFSLVASPLVDD